MRAGVIAAGLLAIGFGNAAAQNNNDSKQLPMIVSRAAGEAMANQMLRLLKQEPHTLVLDENTKIEDVGKLCSTQKCYEIGFHTWKTATHRALSLLVFEIDRRAPIYLGRYRVTDRPVGIIGTKVVFPFSKDVGNEIDFHTAGPPQTVWLDGENSEFFK